ncbi:MAG: hypothetical protein SFZ03_05315 [Candidatus Melainabacteria bacterium]|nr:hypothetical protein [Candidatus Melainabacteria bacterium]
MKTAMQTTTNFNLLPMPTRSLAANTSLRWRAKTDELSAIQAEMTSIQQQMKPLQKRLDFFSFLNSIAHTLSPRGQAAKAPSLESLLARYDEATPRNDWLLKPIEDLAWADPRVRALQSRDFGGRWPDFFRVEHSAYELPLFYGRLIRDGVAWQQQASSADRRPLGEFLAEQFKGYGYEIAPNYLSSQQGVFEQMAQHLHTVLETVEAPKGATGWVV